MTALYRYFVCLVFLFGVQLKTSSADDEIINSKWIKPGALDRWGQQGRLSENTARSSSASTGPDVTDDGKLAIVYYRKLIKTLFNREELYKDPSSDTLFTTDLALKISARQLDKLMSTTSTTREMDMIVSEILEQSTQMRRKFMLRENRCEHLYNVLMELFASQTVRYLLPVVLLIFAFIAIKVISRVTRMHPIIVFLLLIMSITFCNKWHECNEKLARESLQNLETPRTTLSLMLSYISGGTGSSDGIPQLICDPVQVLVDATVSIQAKYFSSMFGVFIGMFHEHTKNASVIGTIMISLLLLGFAYLLISSVMTVAVQSGFQLTGNLLGTWLSSSRTVPIADGTANNGQAQPQLPPLNLNIHIGDGGARILAQNEMLRLENQRVEIVPEDTNGPVMEMLREKEEPKETQPSAAQEEIEVLTSHLGTENEAEREEK